VQCARLLDEVKAEQIVVLDLRKLSDVADFFVIATAGTRRQAQAAATKLQEEAARRFGRRPGVEGYEDGQWVLVDLFDVVVHLFEPHPRVHYDLDMLWGDAPKIKWQTRRRSGGPSQQDATAE